MLLNPTTTKPNFGLEFTESGEPQPVLAGVHALGRVEGVLFELTLRQTYRNASDRLLEVVYTFALPVAAVVMGFATELNGQRRAATVLPRHEAEARYETALAAGDAPVMLEALGDGLHSANIGNLKPGDELVVELRFAQLLSFEQGRLRLSIPTTIAPRFGNAAQAGLQPQQVPQASMSVEYPLPVIARGRTPGPGRRPSCDAEPGPRVDLDPGHRHGQPSRSGLAAGRVAATTGARAAACDGQAAG